MSCYYFFILILCLFHIVFCAENYRKQPLKPILWYILNMLFFYLNQSIWYKYFICSNAQLKLIIILSILSEQAKIVWTFSFRNAWWQPLNCHRLFSLTTVATSSVVSTNRIRITSQLSLHVFTCYHGTTQCGQHQSYSDNLSIVTGYPLLPPR